MKHKKQLIIESAIKCIAKYGVNGTNAQVISDEIGIAQSTIFGVAPELVETFR